MITEKWYGRVTYATLSEQSPPPAASPPAEAELSRPTSQNLHRSPRRSALARIPRILRWRSRQTAAKGYREPAARRRHRCRRCTTGWRRRSETSRQRPIPSLTWLQNSRRSRIAGTEGENRSRCTRRRRTVGSTPRTMTWFVVLSPTQVDRSARRSRRISRVSLFQCLLRNRAATMISTPCYEVHCNCSVALGRR
jgi:hypothetical protein